MEYEEEDYLLLSGIQHYNFCKRQWALIYIEEQWDDNVHTIMGELLHKKAHDRFSYEKRGDILTVRAMPVSSGKLGVSGECDVVEFLEDEEGAVLFGRKGTYRPFPVEYKKGRPKAIDADLLQLAAQAMCLEEMFSTPVNNGAIYYGEIRRREPVEINDELREKVRTTLEEMHRLFERRYTPKVRWSKACSACSIKDICLPKLGKAASAKSYIEHALKEQDT